MSSGHVILLLKGKVVWTIPEGSLHYGRKIQLYKLKGTEGTLNMSLEVPDSIRTELTGEELGWDQLIRGFTARPQHQLSTQDYKPTGPNSESVAEDKALTEWRSLLELERAQQLRAQTALHKTWVWFPAPITWRLAAACTSSSQWLLTHS